jgi:hypothetical protein
MIEATDDEIKFWYDHYVNQIKTKKSKVTYCFQHNLDVKKFNNWGLRFNPWISKFKDHKSRELELYDLYKSTNAPRKYFCTKHNIAMHRLTLVGTYHEYLNRLKIILAESKNQVTIPEITFKPYIPSENHNIPSINEIKIMANETEIVPKSNDIELTITKGVKVILLPEFPSEKIIKVIEFLKEL